MERLQGFEAFITGLFATAIFIPQAIWIWVFGYIAGLLTNKIIEIIDRV